MENRKPGRVARVFKTIFILLVILALIAVVAYLLSDRNHSHYRMALDDERNIVVERGRFFPLGFEPFVPDAKALQDAYAPIPLPASEVDFKADVFDDRADVDRTLFGLLAGWARAGLKAKEAEPLKQATNYIERCELLPGLSEEQRSELRTLRADLAYRNGRRMVEDVVQMLRDALKEFRIAAELGTSRPTDAEAWIVEIKRRIAALIEPRPQPGALADPLAPPPLTTPPAVAPPAPGVGDLTPPEKPDNRPPARGDAVPDEPGSKPSKWQL